MNLPFPSRSLLINLALLLVIPQNDYYSMMASKLGITRRESKRLCWMGHYSSIALPQRQGMTELSGRMSFTPRTSPQGIEASRLPKHIPTLVR